MGVPVTAMIAARRAERALALAPRRVQTLKKTQVVRVVFWEGVLPGYIDANYLSEDGFSISSQFFRAETLEADEEEPIIASRHATASAV